MAKSLQELDDFLRSLETIPEDYAEALREVRDLAHEKTLENFHGEHDPDGRPWAPVSKETQRKKRAQRTGRIGRRSILRDTDAMYLSFLNSDVNEVGKTTLTWGSDDPKAWFHQEGSGRLPARPIVGFSNESLDQVDELVADGAEGNVMELVDGFVG